MWTQIRLLLKEQSDQVPHSLPVCKNRLEKSARIFSRRHKQTTFSDAVFLGALRVKASKFANKTLNALNMSTEYLKEEKEWVLWAYMNDIVPWSRLQTLTVRRQNSVILQNEHVTRQSDLGLYCSRCLKIIYYWQVAKWKPLSRLDYIAPDKVLFSQPKIVDIFLISPQKHNLHKNICCGYSLEARHKGASNEYPQHMFTWRNKKNIFLIPTLIWNNWVA